MEMFDTWIVEREVEKINKDLKSVTKFYVCICKECGKTKEINANNLQRGKSAKCNCQISRHSSDLTGKTFGYWTVLRYVETKRRADSMTTYWECKCQCGTIRTIPRTALIRKNKPRSCGCFLKNKSIEYFHGLYEKCINGCWEWKGTIGTRGYGKLGKTKTPHRFSYEIHKGPITKGKQVCHTCDNRKCVNPDHLFLGSIGDNMRDKTSKGRQAKGSRIGTSILTEAQVLEIRKRRLAGETYEDISVAFNICERTVRGICKNEEWTHVGLGDESRQMKQVRRSAKGEKAGGAKLTESIVLEMRKMRNEGIAVKAIAEKFSCCLATCWDVVRRVTWKHV